MARLFRGPITGFRFFLIFSSFFVVIIAVNMVLAVKAVSTFPGLEVPNSYVASQTFDAERTAQEALGWTVAAEVEGQELVLTITGRDGKPVQPASVTGTFGRATTTRDDLTPAFAFDGSAYRAPVRAAPGNWNLRLKAVAEDGTPFHQRIVLHVTG